MKKLIWIDGTVDGSSASAMIESYRRYNGGTMAADERVGDMYYVTDVTSYRNGCSSRYSLSNRPSHTNQSREPRLHGWCGETNNVNRSAIGVWEVVRVAKNGRIQIKEVTDADRIRAYLDETGYPHLADEIEVEA